MFPWVCLATMPLFYPFDWPKTLTATLIKTKASICKRISHQKNQESEAKIEEEEIKSDDIDIIDNYLLNDQYNDKDKAEVKEVHEEISDDSEDKPNKETLNEKLEMNGKGNRAVKKINVPGYDKKKVTVYLIIFYVLTQAFLPYSHFITQVS